MNEQTIRTQMLLGRDTTSTLSEKHVVIFGIGGVGSFCAEALARAGVGALTLIDDDTVSVSNLNRQLIALHSTVGKEKVHVMAQRIQDINPHCKITALRKRYTAETRNELFPTSADYIADCIDSVPCKTDLIEAAHAYHIPIISAMGTGNKLDPSKLMITDLAKTSGCPLSRVMRRELRKHNIVHHTVVYSTELPVKPIFQPDEGSNVPGSVAWVPSSAGLMMAGYIVQQLLADT